MRAKDSDYKGVTKYKMAKQKKKKGYPQGVSYLEMFGKRKSDELKLVRSKFMKKNNPMFKEENKIKLGKLYTGRKLPKETCKKISEIKKGICPKNIKLLEEKGIKTRFIKGQSPWNKGKKGHLSEESREKISNAGRGRTQSEETKIKRGIYLGRKISETEKKNLSKCMKERRKTIVMPIKDTKIEVKVQDFLKKLRINFTTHQYIKDIKYGYQCDIFIPVQKGINQKTVIECDGDYWHGNLEKFSISKMNKKIRTKRCLDYERTAQLEEAGFRVIRLWEHKIKSMNINGFKLEVSINVS